MSFTLRNNNENGGAGLGATIAVTLTGANVQAGDLVVIGVGCATTAPDVLSSISDGTATYHLLGDNASGATDHLQMAYLLGSETKATGLPTYQANFSGAGASQREIHVWVFTPSATESLDTERHDGNNASSAAIDTGAITTTGTDELCITVGYFDAAQAPSSMQINSVAATGSMAPGGNQASWYTQPSATFTGNGTATITGTRWMACIAAFKIGTSGPGSPPMFRGH